MKVFRPEMEDLPQVMGNMILMVLNHVGWNGHGSICRPEGSGDAASFEKKNNWIVRGLMILMWATSQPTGG